VSNGRNFPDWIKAFQDYASFGEAPPKMHFWTAISTVAGALRRKVWIDQYYFKWYPNFYVIFVAPPGVVAKTTTADVGMDLLRKLPTIKFGPSVVTWQSLVKSFAEGREAFEFPPGSGEYTVMAPLTLAAGELGTLINPQDKEMVDMLVNLWDGKGFRKETKFSGNDEVQNPWINLIGCTTPAWIAGNFPEYMIGGGFTSRCVFVYTDKKEKLVPYPGLSVPRDIQQYQDALVADLEKISNLVGEYKMTKEALEWGSDWYESHNTKRQPHLDDDRFGGYVARKQTHIHKLAMALAASVRDDLVITAEDLKTSASMVTDLELEMVKVFSKIGQSDVSLAAGRLIEFLRKRGKCEYAVAYRYIYTQFPECRDFEQIIRGLIMSGRISLKAPENILIYHYLDGEEAP
jgi:hypothetical protein